MKLLAVIRKELLLLYRDRAGLLILFLMPAVLVLVISLVQENVLKTSVEVLFVDQDDRYIGHAVENMLYETPSIQLIDAVDGDLIDADQAKALLDAGDYQFCIIVPENVTAAMEARVRRMAEAAMGMGAGPEAGTAPPVPDLIVYFDPTVQGAFRTAVLNALGRAVSRMEMELKLKAFADVFPEHLKQTLFDETGRRESGAVDAAMAAIRPGWAAEPAFGVREKFASRFDGDRIPNTVQQNVPAWALFGVFFIAVPLAGSLIRERQDGTLKRLLSMPVSRLTLIGGKLIAYVLICLVQYGVILVIGKCVLPALGAPVLEMGRDPLALAAVVGSSILAAAGFGVLLGTMARTYEQASMFGAIAIVIAAALGGVMVPVYVMPAVMQRISAFSPLAWGLNAFLDIFVRDATFRAVLPEVAALTGLFAAAILISWMFFFRKARTGG